MTFAQVTDHDRNWFGVQTIENTPLIAERLEHMLTGKKYTFASTNDGFQPDSRIGFEVRPDQRLKDTTDTTNSNVWYDEQTPPRFAGFNFSDTYGVWGISTSATNNKYDHTFKAPYWVFEYNQARVMHRAPAGHLLVWVIAVQEDGNND